MSKSSGGNNSSPNESDSDSNISLPNDGGMMEVVRRFKTQVEVDEEELLEVLTNLGVTSLSDLQHLDWEVDLKTVLRPIQIRKLKVALMKDVDIESDKSWTAPTKSFYQFDDQCLTPKFRNLLGGPVRLSTDRRLQLVKIIADDMEDNMSPRPVIEDCERVAKTLCDKWPEALKSLNTNKKHDQLAAQVFRHIEYTRRKHKMEMRQSKDDTPGGSAKKLKRDKPKDRYGIPEERYLPNALPAGENRTSQGEKKEWLIRAAKTMTSADLSKVKKQMTETFVSQRFSIVNNGTVDEILSDWPVLGKFDFLKSHFFHLMELEEEECMGRLWELVPKMRKFVRAVADKNPKQKSDAGSTDTIQGRLITILSDLEGREEDKERNLVGLILALCILMDLDETKLFHQVEETTSYDEIQSSVSLPSHPVIAVLGTDCLLSDQKCFLFVDKCGLYQEPLKKSDAILAIFMAHYVFSIEYHRKLAGLYEFFQRSIFFIDGKGSKTARGKGERQPASVNPKYSGLMRRFSDYSAKWFKK